MRRDEKLDDGFPASPLSNPGRGDVAERTQRAGPEKHRLYILVAGVASFAEMLQRKSLSLSRCRPVESVRGKKKRKKKKKRKRKKGKRGEKKEKSGGEKERADYSGIHEWFSADDDGDATRHAAVKSTRLDLPNWACQPPHILWAALPLSHFDDALARTRIEVTPPRRRCPLRSKFVIPGPDQGGFFASAVPANLSRISRRVTAATKSTFARNVPRDKRLIADGNSFDSCRISI